MSIETKILFGVTMNPKMGAKKMTKIWFDEVDEEIRNLYPDLNAKMEECRTINEILDLKSEAKETAKDISDTTTLAINTAAGIAAGIVTLPADIAAEEAALADVETNIGLADDCKEQIHQEIDKIIPEYLPDEEN